MSSMASCGGCGPARHGATSQRSTAIGTRSFGASDALVILNALHRELVPIGVRSFGADMGSNAGLFCLLFGDHFALCQRHDGLFEFRPRYFVNSVRVYLPHRILEHDAKYYACFVLVFLFLIFDRVVEKVGEGFSADRVGKSGNQACVYVGQHGAENGSHRQDFFAHREGEGSQLKLGSGKSEGDQTTRV